MTTIRSVAEGYLQELKDFREQQTAPGPERDEELCDIIDRHHRIAVRRQDGPKSSTQWYQDGSATST